MKRPREDSRDSMAAKTHSTTSPTTERGALSLITSRGSQITPGRLGPPPSPIRATNGRDPLKVGRDIIRVAAPRAAPEIADVRDHAPRDGIEAPAAVDGRDRGALGLEHIARPVGVGAVDTVPAALDGVKLAGGDAAWGAFYDWGGLSGGGDLGGRGDELVDGFAGGAEVDGVDTVCCVGGDGEARGAEGGCAGYHAGEKGKDCGGVMHGVGGLVLMGSRVRWLEVEGVDG